MIYFRFTWKHLACGCLVINLLLIVLFFRFLEKDVRGVKSSASQSQTEDSAGSVGDLAHRTTAIIVEFEEFENDVPDTILSLCQRLPGIQFVVISDQNVYPPLNLKRVKDCKVRLVTTSADPLRTNCETDPLCAIKSDYVLIVPDGTRVKEDEQFIHTRLNAVSGKNIHAFHVVEDTSDDFIGCLDLKVSVRNWTLTYIPKKSERYECDAFLGKLAFFMQRQTLKELNRPFLRPFDTSLYIQSKLRNLKITVDDEIKFLTKGVVFSTEHNKLKHESLQKQRTSYLYRLFGLKQVNRASGAIEWHGCSRETPRCFPTVVNDMPKFLYDGKWTPPCCLENLRKTARHVFKVLEENGVRYWLEGGSLLGAARNGDIIPWDYDVDIGIYREDIEKCDLLKAATENPVKDSDGFVWEKAVEGEFYRVQYSEINRVHVDLFPFYSRDGTMTKDTWFKTHKQDTEFGEEYLKPLSKIKFVGWDAYAPNNYVKFLEMKFGKGCISKFEYPVPSVLPFAHDN